MSVSLRILLVATVIGIAGWTVTASAYPPYTCGRVRGYVVRSHGPTCTKALRWTRTYLGRHRSPKHFRCRSYGATVPMYCIQRRFSYFFAGRN